MKYFSHEIDILIFYNNNHYYLCKNTSMRLTKGLFNNGKDFAYKFIL